MGNTSVKIEASTIEGHTLEVLGQLIERRVKDLGETSSDAVIATAINILSSLKAETRVVDPEKASGFVIVGEYPGLVAGWKYEKNGHRSRCAREVGGHTYTGSRVINLAGEYMPGERIRVFVAQDRRGTSVNATDERYYILARSEKDAREYAKKNRKRRITQFARLAKMLLSHAQSHISSGSSEAFSSLTPIARRTMIGALQVSVDSVGYASGKCSVSFEDDLRYAALALKGGLSSFELAIKRAANKTAGLIHLRYIDHPLDHEDAPTPFPEAKTKKV